MKGSVQNVTNQLSSEGNNRLPKLDVATSKEQKKGALTLLITVEQGPEGQV